jgi:peptidyl-tRNA hydrolase
MNLMSIHRTTGSRGEFLDAIRSAFGDIAAQGCREVWICDVDFSDWPLSERQVVDSLTRWAYAHRKLTILATSFDEFHRRHARFVEWRRQWSHVVECRAADQIEPGDMASLLFAPGVVSVRLLDRMRYRASVSLDQADAVQCREMVDAISQRSSEAFPATTLGL